MTNTNTATIYIDSDPSCLGCDATAADVEVYKTRLADLIAEEFDLYDVVVLGQVGGWRHRCVERADIDARVREIEEGDEWISLLEAEAP